MRRAGLPAKDRSGETAADGRLEQLKDEKDDAYERVGEHSRADVEWSSGQTRPHRVRLRRRVGFGASGEMGTSPEILFSIAVDFKELKAAQISPEARS
jgi:hypothetical protein